MPIYTYKCGNGHQFDTLRKLSEYKDPLKCECGADCELKIMPTQINCDIQPWDYYESPVSGKTITSYKQREADMKEHNCTDYDPGVKTDFISHMKREDAKLEKKVDDFVDKTISEMPVKKREKLESELNSGADCVYERK